MMLLNETLDHISTYHRKVFLAIMSIHHTTERLYDNHQLEFTMLNVLLYSLFTHTMPERRLCLYISSRNKGNSSKLTHKALILKVNQDHQIPQFFN
jgi:hypothetical protein